MSRIKIAALGGVREEGKNMYAVEVDDVIFVLDAGLIYPSNDSLGIDALIPDFSYLTENGDRVAGIFLSHAHPDAIGALPYLLKEIDVPVFGTALTLKMAKMEASKQGIQNFDQFYQIDESNEIEFGSVTVKFFNVTHSIPQAVGISILTEDGAIVYTGHFKFDMTVADAFQTDFARLTEVSTDHVLALLSESTQAFSYFENEAEESIEEAIYNAVSAAEGRIVFSATELNLMRLQQIINVASKTHRHIFPLNDRIGQTVDATIQLDQLQIPSRDIFKKIETLEKYDDDNIIILENNRNANSLSSLQRMARGSSKKANLKSGDLVIMATSVAFGMEAMVADTKDAIYRAGATAIDLAQDFHTSGHATPKDLQWMLRLMHPKYLIPVSGEYRSMYAHKQLALSAGLQEENVFLLKGGDTIQGEKGELQLGERLPLEKIMIDGSGVGDIGSIVLHDRRVMSEDGVFVIVMTLSRKEHKIIGEAKVISRGFIYMKSNKDLVEESKRLAVEEVNKQLASSKRIEWNKLKNEVRDLLANYLFKETSRRPMILPVIMEATHRRHFKKKTKKKEQRTKE